MKRPKKWVWIIFVWIQFIVCRMVWQLNSKIVSISFRLPLVAVRNWASVTLQLARAVKWDLTECYRKHQQTILLKHYTNDRLQVKEIIFWVQKIEYFSIMTPKSWCNRHRHTHTRKQLKLKDDCTRGKREIRCFLFLFVAITANCFPFYGCWHTSHYFEGKRRAFFT